MCDYVMKKKTEKFCWEYHMISKWDKNLLQAKETYWERELLKDPNRWHSDCIFINSHNGDLVDRSGTIEPTYLDGMSRFWSHVKLASFEIFGPQLE